MDTIATLISLNLQYGVPVDAIVRKFEHMRFEPAGMTANSDIPFAKSFVDYVVRWMGMQFMPGYRVANSPKRDINVIDPRCCRCLASRWSMCRRKCETNTEAPEARAPARCGTQALPFRRLAGRAQMMAKGGTGTVGGRARTGTAMVTRAGRRCSRKMR